jgi:hypothetical protein
VLALVMVTLPAGAQGEPKAETKKEAAPACPPGAFCEETTAAPPEEGAAPEEGTPAEPGEASPTDPAVEGPTAATEGSGEAAEGAEGAEAAQAAEEDGPTTVVLPPPAPGQDPKRPRSFTYIPGADGEPGQVIVYEDGGAPSHGIVEGVRTHKHKRARVHRHRRWGMNLRVDGVLLPQYRDDLDNDSGMAGLGLSLRYRPTPMFALDFAGDFLGGIDANGLERQEVPLALSAMLYANPRNVVQFYLFGGINWSFARVFSEEVQPNLAEGTSDEYTYFGGHAGLGLEFRVSKLVGINVDGLAFIRTRTDDDGEGAYPEFYNPDTQEASNSSAGGLLRAGVTFWW